MLPDEFKCIQRHFAFFVKQKWKKSRTQLLQSENAIVSEYWRGWLVNVGTCISNEATG